MNYRRALLLQGIGLLTILVAGAAFRLGDSAVLGCRSPGELAIQIGLGVGLLLLMFGGVIGRQPAWSWRYVAVIGVGLLLFSFTVVTALACVTLLLR